MKSGPTVRFDVTISDTSGPQRCPDDCERDHFPCDRPRWIQITTGAVR